MESEKASYFEWIKIKIKIKIKIMVACDLRGT